MRRAWVGGSIRAAPRAETIPLPRGSPWRARTWSASRLRRQGVSQSARAHRQLNRGYAHLVARVRLLDSPRDFRSEVQTSVNSTGDERFVAFGPVSSFTPRTPSFSRAVPADPATRAHSTRATLRVAIARSRIERRVGHPCARSLPPTLASTTARLLATEPDGKNTRFADRVALVECKPRPLPRSFHKPRRRDGRSGNAREDVSRRGATWCVTVPGFSTRAFCSRIRQSRVAHAPRRPRVAFRPNRVFFHSSLGSALTATTFPRRDAGEAPTLARARGGRV